MTEVDLCGKIKISGAPGIYGMGVDEMRKQIVQIYNQEKIQVPSFQGLSRKQLCQLLTLSKSGLELIKKSQVEQQSKKKPAESQIPSEQQIPIEPQISIESQIPMKPKVPMKPKIQVKPKIPMKPKIKVKPKIPMKPKIPIKPKIKVEPKIQMKPEKPITPPIITPPVITPPIITPAVIVPEIFTTMDCSKYGGLLNQLSSCYLDSTLLALLFKNNEYINKNILNVNLSKIKLIIKKGTAQESIIPLNSLPDLYQVTQQIQEDLKTIKNNILKGTVETCTFLRKHLDTHQKIYVKQIGPLNQINWINAQQEPLDVMLRLDTIFNLPEAAIIRRTGSGTFQDAQTAKLITKQEISFPVKIIIDALSISQVDVIKGKINNITKTLDLTSFINTSNIIDLGYCNYYISPDNKKIYSKRIEQLVYIQSPMLYVHVGRIADQIFIGGHGKIKITTPILPSLDLPMQNQSPLRLTAILIHHGGVSGGHYTSFLNCNDLWYSYNDVGFQSLKLIGDFKSLLLLQGSTLLGHATDYFYM